MKTAISIPDSEFEAAEKLATRLGMSRSELYRRAIAEFIASHCNENVTAKLNEIYSAEDQTGTIDKELLQLQEESIPKDEW